MATMMHAPWLLLIPAADLFLPLTLLSSKQMVLFVPYISIVAYQFVLDLAVSITSTAASCPGGTSPAEKLSDGTVSAVVTGGVPPYSYHC